ncbi:MAG: hypothetical protein OIF51_15950 [Cellvibrionaceae bacterium]|nr:hypothetical protein [Cellvibrionaceae bacterium]
MYKMKTKHLVITLSSSLVMLYIGLFLGDLGGVGGYDGIAPGWLYEKVIFQSSDTIFQLAGRGSRASLAIGLFLLAAFIVCLVIFIVQRFRPHAKNS